MLPRTFGRLERERPALIDSAAEPPKYGPKDIPLLWNECLCSLG
jgi:hypothetical protein